MAHNTQHVIYGIIEREFVRAQEFVIKVGHTAKPFYKRLSAYPKGSQMVFAVSVTAGTSRQAEADLLACMRSWSGITSRSDVGAEYFELPTQHASLIVSHCVTQVLAKYMWTPSVHRPAESSTSDAETVDSVAGATATDAATATVYDMEEDASGVVASLVESIFQNVCARAASLFETVYDFVDAHVDRLSLQTVQRDVLVDEIRGCVSSSRDGKKISAGAVKRALMDLGAREVNAMLGNRSIAVPAWQFPDLLKNDDNVAGLEEERCDYIANNTKMLAEWLDEVVQVTGLSSDAVWIGDLKTKWKETHFGSEAAIFSTKFVKAYFAGKQGTEWKEVAQFWSDNGSSQAKRGVIRGVNMAGIGSDSANPLTEWLDKVVQVTGLSSDAVWIGDLKTKWKETHFGPDAAIFSTKLVKAYFAGKQGTEWKEVDKMKINDTWQSKRGNIRGCAMKLALD